MPETLSATEQIVADATADLNEGAETNEGTETVVETPEVVADSVVDPAKVPDKVADTTVVPPVVDPAVEFAKEHGLEAPVKGGRVNKIPQPRVQEMVTKAQEKAVAGLAAEILGKPLEAGKSAVEAIKAHVAASAGFETEVKTHRATLENVAKGEKLMVEQPEKFLELLPSLNPKYAELLAGKGVVPAAKVDPADPKPAPDFDIKNEKGEIVGKTYSPEGLDKLLAWNTAQAVKTVKAEVDGTLKPIRDKAAADKYEKEVIIPRLQATVNNAIENWPGFKENQAEIIKELEASNAAARADKSKKSMDLNQAYISVINRKHTEQVAKLTQTKEQSRKELMDELKNAPKSTTAKAASASGRSVEVEEDGASSTEDIVRAAIAGLK